MFTLKIGGQAGQGIKSAGLLFAKLASRSGYYIYTHTEYPSLIRGGHNVMQINVSEEVVASPCLKTDLLIALDQTTIDKCGSEITGLSGLIYDSDKNLDVSKIKGKLFPIPLSKFAKSAGGDELLVNTIALGAVVALLGGNLETLKNLLSEEYAEKKQELIELNKKVSELSYGYTKEKFGSSIKSIISPLKKIQSKTIVNGNEAVALGAIAGGLQFASMYPMSPASNILHVLAQYQEKYGYVYKQPEDEISAINMAIGASYAGARSMTSTSGGGFSLMVEGYGLAGMTETPVVIVDGMRGGPATGLPTWSEQGDLQFVLNAHQGDFPRIVLAAGDSKETFELTMKAFNLADKYQTPVMLLIDKNICENDQSYPVFDISKYNLNRGNFITKRVDEYQRYKIEPDGIHRSIPVGNFFITNSDEHDETGFSTEEISDRNSQMQKRMKKLETCAKEDMEPPELYGLSRTALTIVSWGSNKGSILEAIKDNTNVNFLYLKWMSPFPSDEVKKILENSRYILDIEATIPVN
jgi:2-oxoglutarate ferredoxin oxidoreductase subunit alpha